MRAISTVLDATVFLLLVSTAVLTLVGPGAPPQLADNGAGEAATVLVTTTAQVNYSLAPGAAHADESVVSFERKQGPGFERTAHGTLAGLLGDAALASVRVDGQLVTHTGGGFGDAVATATVDALRRPACRTQVRAVWSPYPGAPVRGRVVVGANPPPDAAVQAATVSVSSGADLVDSTSAANGTGSFADLADALARATVGRLFPVETTQRALGRDFPVDALVAYRYARFADLGGVSLPGRLDRDAVRGTNRRMSAALAARFEADLRKRFETPGAARSRVTIETVRITVRRWAP